MLLNAHGSMDEVVIQPITCEAKLHNAAGGLNSI
jgi:hypothetical protein